MTPEKSPPAAETMLVVIYLRVSTEDQARRGYSLPEQEDACLGKARALAAAHAQATKRRIDLQPTVFTDAVSGEILERPELEKVRAYVKAHQPAYFVCLDPDRFSRQTYHAILVANEIEAAGTKLEFVQHDYQKTPEGRLFFTLRLAIAEYEKAKILERTMSGKRRMIKSGRLPNGINLFGYRYDKQTATVSPHPEEAPWIVQMFRWAHEHLSYRAIADRLNALGVQTKRGGARWYQATIRQILKNRGYIGELILNRYDARGLAVQRQLPKHLRTRSLTMRVRPEAEWTTVPLPPLVTKELWEAVQVVLLDARRRRAVQGSFLLSGLLGCGFCGAPVHYRPHSVTGHILMCANRYKYQRDLAVPLPECKLLPHQKAGPIEDRVWRIIGDWLTDPDALLEYLQQRRSNSDVEKNPISCLQDELTLVDQQLAKKQKEQMRILTVVRSGAVDPAVAAAELTPLKEQIDQLRLASAHLWDRLDEVGRQADQHDHLVSKVVSIQDELLQEEADVRSRLDRLDVPQRQHLVRMLIRRVVLYPKGALDLVPFA